MRKQLQPSVNFTRPEVHWVQVPDGRGGTQLEMRWMVSGQPQVAAPAA